MSGTFTGSRFMPALRYRNLSAAIDWLCGAFGFERHDVVTAVDGTIQRARLKFGQEVILLLPSRHVDPSTPKSADAIGYELQSCYFIIDDPDEHCFRAKNAGAELIETMEYDDGGRGYSCRDLEGHIWNFVTYDSSLPPDTSDDNPRLTPSEPVDVSNAPADGEARGSTIVRPVILTMIVGTVITAAFGSWLLISPQSVPKASALLGYFSNGKGAGSQVVGRTHVDRLPVKENSGAPRTEQAFEGTAQPKAQSTAPPNPALLTLGLEKRHDGDERTTRPENEPAAKVVAVEFPQEAPVAEVGAAQAAQRDEARVKGKPIARALDGPETQSRTARPAVAHEQKGNSEPWDCQPNPTGTVVCKPPGKQPAAAELAAPKGPKAKLITGPPNPPSPAKPQARTAESQVWDCRARPPTGEVICRPNGSAP